MRKYWGILVGSLLCFAVLIGVLSSFSASAQTAISGDWKAEYRTDKDNKIQLFFEYRIGKGRNQHGSSYDFADLPGLTREKALSADSVKFSLIREAGMLDCEGKFDGNGKGTGTFRFTSNPQFVAAMKSRGFDFTKTSKDEDEDRLENKLFAAATLNVTTALADDLLSANFGKLGVDDLFKAAIFKVDSKFMTEMKNSGFPNLVFEDLVKARIFKIDADFVREVVAMGFDKEPFESLVKMRIFKVTPEFINEIQGEGLRDLSVEDYVKMRIFKIDGKFIRQAKAENVPLNVENLVQKRIGVGRN